MAIGLAAQTIVKDCLNGMLILIEDQYNVGDVVRLADEAEPSSQCRCAQLYSVTWMGPSIPFPIRQITSVANLTRDYSVATINVSVDFSADPDKVMTVLNDAAMSVRNDPAYSDLYLADPKLLGIDSVKGSQAFTPSN